MLQSYTIDVAEDASALTHVDPLASAEFLETSDIEEDIPKAWPYVAEDASALTHIDPFGFPFAEFLETADLEDDIPEAWLEEHFVAITDDEDAYFLDQLIFVQTDHQPYNSPTQKVSIPEWIFLIINVLIELLSAAFDQLSSVNKPQHALIAMLMSFAAAITCIIELAYKAGKQRVIWRWESKLPWFYHPSPSHKRFGTFPEMIGLVCALLQAILSAVAYIFYLQHANYPLKVSWWPLVFALGLFCSKLK